MKFWLFSLGLGLGALMMLKRDNRPRGIRNNNPGNIEAGGDAWNGAVGDDGRFVIFSDALWGIRAMARILGNYQRLYGIDTVAGVVSRWAPPHENPTATYAAQVAEWVGVEVDQPVQLTAIMPELVAALIRFENGQQPYPYDLIRDGVALA